MVGVSVRRLEIVYSSQLSRPQYRATLCRQKTIFISSPPPFYIPSISPLLHSISGPDRTKSEHHCVITFRAHSGTAEPGKYG